MYVFDSKNRREVPLRSTKGKLNIILKCDLKKYNVRAWTRVFWLRKGISGGLL
jgi:hypothetical protein